MLRITVVLASAAAALAMASPAAAANFVIHGDWKLGSFAVKRDGTLRGAIDAFGAPSSRHRSGESCTVRWSRYRLKIDFYNLGGRNPCKPAYGFFSNARAKGPRWETNRGLAIGDRERRLRRLYPDATFHPREPAYWPAGWWLVERRSPFGSGGTYPGLHAQVRDGRVAAFRLRYPAGGD